MTSCQYNKLICYHLDKLLLPIGGEYCTSDEALKAKLVSS